MSHELPILVLTGRYHLGDNVGLFQNSTWVGHALHLPVTLSWRDPAAKTLIILVHTHDVETWGDWEGHAVLINGTEVGRLKDPADKMHGRELFRIDIEPSAFDAAAQGKTHLTLSVLLETQPSAVGMADDFGLRRIETLGMVLRPGWR